MDILSDVNVVGKLYAGSFRAGRISGGFYKDHPIIDVDNVDSETHNGVEFHNGQESHKSDEQHDGVVRYSSQVYFKRTGVCTSGGVENYNQVLSPSENWITIPANCTKFLIKTYDVCATYYGDELSLDDKHILIHPLVTAWSDGKTVGLDLEICAEVKDGVFYEYLLGKVTSSSTDREMNIVVY